MHTTYIALGSNLGERLANLRHAVAAMPPDVRPIGYSPVYETPPWGFSKQPAFLNAVICAETDLEPKALLACLKRLEVKLGREPTFRYGPRLIDLDVLFYDDLVMESPGLTIPHPRLQERAFVLAPLADLAPDFQHPRLLLSVREMAQAVDTSGIRRLAEGLQEK